MPPPLFTTQAEGGNYKGTTLPSELQGTHQKSRTASLSNSGVTDANQPTSHRQNWALPAQLAAHNWRGMDPRNDFWYAANIHISTSSRSDTDSELSETDSQGSQEFDRLGDPNTYRQECYYQDDRGRGFSQHHFYSPQEEWRSSNDFGPKKPKSASNNIPLQDGRYPDVTRPGSPKRVYDEVGPHRRIYDHSYCQTVPQVSSLPMERYLLHVPGPTIRTLNCSKSIHKGYEGPNINPEEMVDSSYYLPGRHFDSKSNRSGDPTGHGTDDSTTSTPRFRDKYEKVDSSSNPGDRIIGICSEYEIPNTLHPRFQAITNPETDKELSTTVPTNQDPRIGQDNRDIRVNQGSDVFCPIVHESLAYKPRRSAKSPIRELQQNVVPNFSSQTGTEVVVQQHPISQDQSTDHVYETLSDNHNRCLTHCLGRNTNDTHAHNHKRRLDANREETSHQPPRIVSNKTLDGGVCSDFSTHTNTINPTGTGIQNDTYSDG